MAFSLLFGWTRKSRLLNSRAVDQLSPLNVMAARYGNGKNQVSLELEGLEQPKAYEYMHLHRIKFSALR